MKVFTKLSLFLLMGIGIVATGCKDPNKDNPQSQVTVNLVLPEGTTGELSEVSCNFTNLNTTAKTSVTEFVANSAIVTLDKGAYSVEVSGKSFCQHLLFRAYVPQDLRVLRRLPHAVSL